MPSHIDGSLAQERRPLLQIALMTAALGAAIVGGITLAALRERDRWRAFVIENDCKKVAVVKGRIDASPTVGVAVIPGQSAVGTVVGTSITVEDDKVAWRCRDGNLHWR